LACNGAAWGLMKNAGGEDTAARALPVAEHAVRLQPANYFYQNILGLVLYRVGRYRDAVARLEGSLQARPQSKGFDEVVLAMCCQRLGQRDKARQWFDRLEVLRQGPARLPGADAA